MARAPILEAPPESDTFGDAPNPRETMLFFGHAGAEATLLEAYRSGKLPQAWLIGGREGIGKATLAWRFAKFILANPDPNAAAVQQAGDLSVDPNLPAVRRVLTLTHGDVALLRRTWNEKTKKHFTEIRIDEVRAMLDLFKQASGEGGWRVAIVDCAEDLNASSANALLKMIEEPPPRSLFLILAHKPGQVLPTIRSRCRRLSLDVLTTLEVAAAMTALGSDFANLGAPQIGEAAAKSGGSVRQALRLLDGDGLALTKRLDGLLARLPEVDWRSVHALADAVSGREKTSEYEALVNGVYEYLDASVHTGAPPARLAPFAEVWEKTAAAVRETDVLNLDRRPLILSIFADLSSAARAAKA